MLWPAKPLQHLTWTTLLSVSCKHCLKSESFCKRICMFYTKLWERYHPLLIAVIVYTLLFESLWNMCQKAWIYLHLECFCKIWIQFTDVVCMLHLHIRRVCKASDSLVGTVSKLWLGTYNTCRLHRVTDNNLFLAICFVLL